MARFLRDIPRGTRQPTALTLVPGESAGTLAAHPPSTLDRQMAEVMRNLYDDRGQSSPSSATVRGRVLGRYIVLGELGSGGMGTVLKAYDESLDRAIAIKLLHSETSEHHIRRLKREAQALAKLSHPNVVHVYEVDQADDQWFIAMEMVSGQTLRQWQGQRGWRECIDVYLQAGEGLAAAHAAGLVHRDFKPDNCVIDDEGRPRVLDFGLVAEAEVPSIDEVRDEREPETGDAPAIARSLTVTGTVMGTPAYMPLEQMKGQEADARSDQFSFCVSLYEALYGERPYEGCTLETLMESVYIGAIGDNPRGTPVPVKIREILLRGLAAQPEDRWPSMDALLAELRGQIAPRKRGLALGLGFLSGLTALGVALAYLTVMGRCTGAQTQLEGIWDDTRRHAVRDAILGTEMSYAADTWERVEALLDDHASAWIDKHTEVCEATAIRREQSEEEMSLRMGCLRERKTALNAAVKVLVRADAQVVESAVKLVPDVSELARCDDIDTLLIQRQHIRPPEDPQTAQQVRDSREFLADITAMQRSGKYAQALEYADAAVERAEGLGYMPLVAEARLQRGELRDENGMYVEAEQDLLEAYTLATELEHDNVLIEAATHLIFVVGQRQSRYAEGLVWGQTVIPLAKRAGETTELATIIGNMGIIQHGQGNYREAEAHFRQAMRMWEHISGPNHPNVAGLATNLGNSLQSHGNYVAAEPYFRQAIQILEDALGAGHPDIATSINGLGLVLQGRGMYEEARSQHQRALRLSKQTLGENHPIVAASMTNIGNTLECQGRNEEAAQYHRKALGIWESTLSENHPNIAMSANNLGNTLYNMGDHEGAEAQYLRALRIWRHALGDDHPHVAISMTNLGNALQEQGRYAEAEYWHRKGLQIRETVLGKEHPEVAASANNLGNTLARQKKYAEAKSQYQRALDIWEQETGTNPLLKAYPLVGLAKVGLAQQEFEAAREYAERAVSIREHETDLHQVASALFILARTLWPNESRRADARELATRAHEIFTKHGKGSEEDLAEVERWLAEHHVRSR